MSQKVSLTLAELAGIRNLYRAAWPYEEKTIAKLERAIKREEEMNTNAEAALRNGQS